MTTDQPTEPPTSGPAVEVPPHGEHNRPTTTVYRYPRPSLWVYWPDRWQYADVRARQVYANGTVVYQVELNDAEGSRVSRSFLWGRDSVRAAGPTAVPPPQT